MNWFYWLTIWGAFLQAGISHAIDLSIDDDESIKSAAEQAAHGMFMWYAGNETGQIPGSFPEKWWEGSALFMASLQYWKYTGDTTYNSETSQGLEHQSGDGGDYMPSNYSTYLGNDDQGFWGLTAMLAAELQFPDVKDGFSWLSLAQGVFNTQIDRWDTSSCNGGLRWQLFTYQAGYAMKNTISNGVLFQLSARLARYTNNQTYADWAEKIYDWMESTPLLNEDTWHIADSVDIDDNCKSPGNNQWSYNYGTFIMGSAYMHNYTSDDKWLKRVNGFLGTTFTTFFPKRLGGNTMQEPCEPTEQCNSNEILFKGLVTSWLAYTALFIPSTKDKIQPKLKASAEAAADSCAGMGNNTCGVRWYQHKWDGWNGMEEQIIATNVFMSNLIIESDDKGPVTSETGGDSKSNPDAGSSGGGDNSGQSLKKITTGDKAGAGILTALFVGVWVGMVAFMITGAG